MENLPSVLYFCVDTRVLLVVRLELTVICLGELLLLDLRLGRGLSC